MKNRALIGLSAACMSALVATAVGCGEPAVDPYTPPAEEETAVETAVTEEPAAEEETTAEAEADATEETTEAADATEETEAADATEEAEAADTEAEATDEADATDAEAEAAAGSYADGTYEGTGKGIGSNAIEQLPELIVEANGTEGVDGVSGATITSNAIFTAVEEALEQAQA